MGNLIPCCWVSGVDMRTTPLEDRLAPFLETKNKKPRLSSLPSGQLPREILCIRNFTQTCL